MRKISILWLFMGMTMFSYAQELNIYDQQTLQPLELVTVYSSTPEITAVTNAEGKVDISPFREADSIYFQYVGYRTEVYSYAQLEARKFKVALQPSAFSLDEVVVAVTRWAQEKKDIPQKVTTIRPEEVALQNPQTAADMLAVSGDVYIQKSQLGGGSPMIRGFATNRVLMAVDGVRMNTAIFRSGNLQNVISLDPFATERTEIVFGPGSVIYGSDAIGGVMSFHTLQPKLAAGENPLIRGSATTRYASANHEKTAHVHLNIGLRKWAFVSSATFTDYNDQKMGSNGPDDYLRPEYVQRINGEDTVVPNPDPKVQVPTGYHQLNLMQKVRFQPGENWDFQYGFHYSTTSDYSRYDRLIRYRGEQLGSAEWYYGPQKWMMNVLNATHTRERGLYDKASATLAYQFFEESRHDRDFGDITRFHRTEQVNVFSLNLDFEKNLTENQRLFYGTEILLNQVGSAGEDENIETGEVVPASPRYPDGATWHSYAAYASYMYKPTEKVTLQTGLRYNQINLDATFDTSFYPLPFSKADLNTGALTGSAGMAYHPAESWQVNLNLSTGFRAPNIDDIGKIFDSAPGLVVVPNPDLVPEYAYNGEIGVAKTLGEVAKIDITAYYTVLNQALVRRNYTLNGMDSIVYDGELSQVQAIQNAARAYVWGLQTTLEVNLPSGFGLTSTFNYQQGEEELDDGSTAPLRHAPPWFGATHLTYKYSGFQADLYGIYNGEVAYTDLAPSEIDKSYLYAKDARGNPYAPGWYTLNFKALYQLTKYLRISAGVENISDQRYRPYSSGIAAAGRNFIISLNAAF